MVFEWDDEKEQKNIAKHRISFRTAMLVFQDNERLEKYDAAHSLEEDRYITIGKVSGTYMVVTVVYTERSTAVRIISARLATKLEQEVYYGHKNNL